MEFTQKAHDCITHYLGVMRTGDGEMPDDGVAIGLYAASLGCF